MSRCSNMAWLRGGTGRRPCEIYKNKKSNKRIGLSVCKKCAHGNTAINDLLEKIYK